MQLESEVQNALARNDGTGLDVLGYGEVTLVLRIRTDAGSYACKRLPRFPDEARFHTYQELVAEYVEQLGQAGMHVAETRTWSQAHPDGGVTGYCVQPELPAARLGSRVLANESSEAILNFFGRFLDAVWASVSATTGLDAQASNWIDDGELTYVDVTTPLLRDGRGRERLDVRLFFESLPWVLRDAIRISTSKSIFDKFYQPRGVVLDFVGNLHKERLTSLIPQLLPLANQRLSEPITEAEVAAYYRSDARTWAMVQRLRRMDRQWQNRVRRRPYPFLLPPVIAR
ncbi:MAG: DUF6206 family protein [Jatrophihabitantaceae bacterium]